MCLEHTSDVQQKNVKYMKNVTQTICKIDGSISTKEGERNRAILEQSFNISPALC